jgi:hypothetical protein
MIVFSKTFYQGDGRGLILAKGSTIFRGREFETSRRKPNGLLFQVIIDIETGLEHNPVLI